MITFLNCVWFKEKNRDNVLYFIYVFLGTVSIQWKMKGAVSAAFFVTICKNSENKVALANLFVTKMEI